MLTACRADRGMTILIQQRTFTYRRTYMEEWKLRVLERKEFS